MNFPDFLRPGPPGPGLEPEKIMIHSPSQAQAESESEEQVDLNMADRFNWFLLDHQALALASLRFRVMCTADSIGRLQRLGTGRHQYLTVTACCARALPVLAWDPTRSRPGDWHTRCNLKGSSESALCRGSSESALCRAATQRAHWHNGAAAASKKTSNNLKYRDQQTCQ